MTLSVMPSIFKKYQEDVMKGKMNIPNTLSLIRALLVPVFVAVLLFLRNDLYLC